MLDSTLSAQLLASDRKEVTSYGDDIVADTATDLVPGGLSGFLVLLDGDRRISARRLMVTPGLCDKLPEMAGLSARWWRAAMLGVAEGFSDLDEALARPRSRG